MPKAKPDDRSDNVEKLQDVVQDTVENIENAHDTMQNQELIEEDKQQLIDKNKRREEALDGLRAEIKDEARDRKN